MGGGGRREVGGQMQPRNAAPEKKTCDANFEWRNVNATIENSSFYVFLVVAFLLAEAAREASETATSSESDKIMPHLYVVEHRPHGLDHVERGATNF